MTRTYRFGIITVLLLALSFGLSTLQSTTAQASSSSGIGVFGCDSSPKSGEQTHNVSLSTYARYGIVKPGDIILIAGSGRGSYGVWCHAGIWGTKNGRSGTWESLPSGGVQFSQDGQSFQNAVNLAILHVWTDDSTKSRAAAWAANQEGKPYREIRYYYDKFNENTFYCSQLVWAAYRHADSHIDLDNNGKNWWNFFDYAFVSPDDLWASGWVHL